MHEAFDLLTAEDFENPPDDNLLVSSGYPFELAFRFADGSVCFSVATEIGGHLPLEDRLRESLQRLSAACHKLGIDASYLHPIELLLTKRHTHGAIAWLIHTALMGTGAGDMMLKIYLGPCLVGDSAMTDSQHEGTDDVWRAVEALLRSYDLDKEVADLASIRRQLTMPGKGAPQITFVGVDLRPGTKPGFKVYLNPNVGAT
ncbi:MAG: hypothetical protein H6811_09935 [Phycisphaeraceae bacterium]|nr:hypothetical protein [Phycisphaeraceae bacterium]